MTATKQEVNGKGEGAAPSAPTAEPPLDLFPCESFREAAPYLRRPFTPEAVGIRLLGGQSAAVYITARQVIERLNLVLPHLWSATYEPTANGLLCHLSVDGITRTDVGQGGDPKALISDALKRAAVHFGVGVSLYALDTPWVKDPKHLRNKQGKVAGLTSEGEKHLRDGYRRWVQGPGQLAFGTALDHGDIAGATPSEVEAQGSADLAPTYLIDEQADELRTKARDAYHVLTGIPGGSKLMAPGAFDQALRAASAKHEDLGEFVEIIAEMCDTMCDTARSK